MKVQRATIYRANGDISSMVAPADDRQFTLAELQKLVGGYIELVPGTGPLDGESAYCSEEGRIRELLPNERASIAFGMRLCGDVVLVRTHTLVKPRSKAVQS